jgi:molecular chaperone GrpE (heat shock protein)
MCMQVTLQEQSARLLSQLGEAEKEVAEMKDRALRTLADMENLRTRTSQQIEETRQFALQSFAKDILDVADNLERALGSVPADLLEGDVSKQQVEVVSKNLRSFHNGVALSQRVRASHALLWRCHREDALGEIGPTHEECRTCSLPGLCRAQVQL